ncbi:hypothetical protein ACL02T_23510 [Pseudonocardia sp. RS010]|uniref:hypothetical protein n=1 Tax=Pseudonocardia sp. RS010 TaxID=3385979 RepID=UPI0039A069BF
MVVGPEYGAILGLAFSITRRDLPRVRRRAREARGALLQLLLNVTVLTAVAIAGLPAQRAIRRRAVGRGGRDHDPPDRTT